MKPGKKKSGTKSILHSKKTGSVSIKRLLIYLISTVVVLFSLVAVLVFSQIAVDASRIQHVQLESVASSYAGQIGELARSYRQSLALQAKDPEIQRMLHSGDDIAIKQREQMLSYVFPEAIRIKFFRSTDELSPDKSLNPPISYACIDLLRKAADSGKALLIEVHSFGRPEQHIDVVQPVLGLDGRPVGSLMLTLSFNSFKQILGRLSMANAYVELQQENDRGQISTFTHRGAADLKNSGDPYLAKIPGTRWRIAYWSPETGGVSGGLGALVYWLGFIGAILLVCLVAVLLYARLMKAMNRDHVTIIKIIKDIRDNSVATRYPVSLVEFAGLIGQVQLMARDLTGRKSTAPQAGKAAKKTQARSAASDIQGLSGDLTTDALEVEELADAASASRLPEEIFRAYDIRGIVGKTLTQEIVLDIGRAIGSEVKHQGLNKIVVARDGRMSGPELMNALVHGLQSTGLQVLELGQAPTPVLYFATHYLGNGSGVMLTGSHNPPDYNGLKIMIGGLTLHGDTIKALRERILSGRLVQGDGETQTLDVVPSYIERISSDVRLERPMKIVIDCGNGVAGMMAPQLFRSLNCEVIELFCEVDGNFPNHHPDPSKPENLVALIRTVNEHKADLGIAFDGDGDRLGVVDSDGKIIWPDRFLMLMARDVLMRQPGSKIIYDVKCTRHLASYISEHGGDPLMWKTGHSFIKAKMLETDAQLAGEMSGHVFFKERWFGFDDALYAAARLLEILSAEEQSSTQVFAGLPEDVSTPELSIELSEGEQFRMMQKLIDTAKFGGAKLITIDGLRVEFEDGWGLVRASNTTPTLVLRFEAESAESLSRIQQLFRDHLLSVKADMTIPF
ncbi:MAG TPA: phosphomannomutase/phosphoglucomutase [Gammaproteobacteria bacterium]|nr:phosphomannomutase/phosphoglucomutase [Gammaproteobacteria bacterium]